MTKRVFPRKFFVLICFFIVMIQPVLAQSPVGKWVDSGQNVTLTLNGDFTYSLTYPNGNSTGYWSSGGNQFCLRDAAAATPVCYTVVSYSASALVLRDVNGVMINYKKVNITQPAVPSGWNRKVKGAGRVIAEKGNLKLTHGHLRTGIDLTQFIIGHKIKDNEVKALKQKLVQEFNTAPAETLSQLNGIRRSMNKVYSSTDPYRIGLVRQELFGAFYKVTKNINESQKPLMIRIINKYVRVLAYDEKNNLILTNRDVDGYINYLIFNSELSGQKIDANYAVKRDVSAQLVKKFFSMPIGQKQMLASASLIWQLFDTNWRRMSRSQKNQYVTAYRNKISNNFSRNSQEAGFGQQWKPPQGAYKKSVAQMKSEFNAKQNMFRMMQNMNTNSHALSLNIIENTGGTGNYWNVVDY